MVTYVEVAIEVFGGSSLTLEITPNQPVVIVGPNGSGKSALGGHIAGKVDGPVNHIYAHRRLWLDSAGSELTASRRKAYEHSFRQWDSALDSRWRDHGDQMRLASIIFDLMSRQAGVDSKIADRVRGRQETHDLDLEGPLQILNSIFQASGLDISISVQLDDGELYCATPNGASYPVSEMSDGEKSALLLIADVLVSPLTAVHFIDEPERHLHRSISASLITSLIESRPTDAFVVFTHDLDLAQYLGRFGTTYILQGCEWEGSRPVRWNLRFLPEGNLIPERLRREILGGRSRITYHEGTQGGLDQQLYEALFPKQNVVALGSCSDVIRAVSSLSKIPGIHWVAGTGIVDRDFRREQTPPGVHLLSLHEVENAFYAYEVVLEMATHQAAIYGVSKEELMSKTWEGMRTALRDEGVKMHLLQVCSIQLLRNSAIE